MRAGYASVHLRGGVAVAWVVEGGCRRRTELCNRLDETGERGGRVAECCDGRAVNCDKHDLELLRGGSYLGSGSARTAR